MVTLELYDVHAGWASARIASGSSKMTVRTSHTPNDSIRDFVDAIASLSTAQCADCCWPQEPGEIHWRFIRSNREITVEVVEFEDVMFPGRHGSGGVMLFKATAELAALGRQLLASLEVLKRSLGTEGYEREWRHPFPAEAVEKLRAVCR